MERPRCGSRIQVVCWPLSRAIPVARKQWRSAVTGDSLAVVTRPELCACGEPTTASAWLRFQHTAREFGDCLSTLPDPGCRVRPAAAYASGRPSHANYESR